MLLTRGLLRLFFLPLFWNVLRCCCVPKFGSGKIYRLRYQFLDYKYCSQREINRFRAFGVHRPAAVQSDTSLKMFRAHNECSRVYIV